MAADHTIRVSNQELSTILAALRFYQQHGLTEESRRPFWLDLITTNEGQQETLADQGLDELCHTINRDSKLFDQYARPSLKSS